MPEKHLYVPYEKKKDEYLTALYQDFEETLKNSETGTEEMETGIVLVCQNCRYMFRYKKASWSPKCTRCGAPVDIPTHLKPYVGIQHIKLDYGYVMDPQSGNVVSAPEGKENKRVNPDPDGPDIAYLDNSENSEEALDNNE